MNGRSVANWGLDSTQPVKGSIARALFEPSDRWHLEQDGLKFERQGIESRCFCFTSSNTPASIADDGGLIELRVYRAQYRRRNAPDLQAYRSDGKYGIT